MPGHPSLLKTKESSPRLWVQSNLLAGIYTQRFKNSFIKEVLFEIKDRCRTGQKLGLVRRRPWRKAELYHQRTFFPSCKSPIIQLVCPPKFCQSIVFYFSWDHCNTQEKSKTKVIQIEVFFFGGGGSGGGGQQGVFWEMCKRRMYNLRLHWINTPFSIY